jgi:hypothetical protein
MLACRFRPSRRHVFETAAVQCIAEIILFVVYLTIITLMILNKCFSSILSILSTLIIFYRFGCSPVPQQTRGTQTDESLNIFGL